MKTKATNLIARCNDGSATLQELKSLYEKDREVSFATFFRFVSLAAVSKLLGYRYRGPDVCNGGTGLCLRNDHHVRYYRSEFRGKICWHLDWSAIDHVFA